MKLTNNKALALFALVPFVFSIISTIHLVSFATLGNLPFLAIAFSVVVELGAIVTFITMSPNILKLLNKTMLLFMFIILFGLQAIGNVYAIFDYIMGKVADNPMWLNSFDKMTMETMDPYMQMMTIAVLLGLFVPIVSLMLLKSGIDYLSKNLDDEDEGINEGVNEGVTEGVPIPDALPTVEEKVEGEVNDAVSEGVSDAVNDGVSDEFEVEPITVVEPVVKQERKPTKQPPTQIEMDLEDKTPNTEKDNIPEINKNKEVKKKS